MCEPTDGPGSLQLYIRLAVGILPCDGGAEQYFANARYPETEHTMERAVPAGKCYLEAQATSLVVEVDKTIQLPVDRVQQLLVVSICNEEAIFGEVALSLFDPKARRLAKWPLVGNTRPRAYVVCSVLFPDPRPQLPCAFPAPSDTLPPSVSCRSETEETPSLTVPSRPTSVRFGSEIASAPGRDSDDGSSDSEAPFVPAPRYRALLSQSRSATDVSDSGSDAEFIPSPVKPRALGNSRSYPTPAVDSDISGVASCGSIVSASRTSPVVVSALPTPITMTTGSIGKTEAFPTAPPTEGFPTPQESVRARQKSPELMDGDAIPFDTHAETAIFQVQSLQPGSIEFQGTCG